MWSHGVATSPDFRLHADEPLAEGVRRVLLEQVLHAVQIREVVGRGEAGFARRGPGGGGQDVDAREDFDDAVHELRKSLKRSRAVLRLVRGPLGDYRYRQENTALRDTGRLWGPTRDAAVLVETAESALPGVDLDEEAAASESVLPGVDLDEEAAGHLLAVLRAQAAASTAAAQRDRRRQLDSLTALGSFACRVRRFPVRGPGAIPDAWESVQPGLTRVARRAARRMGRAAADPTTERLHAWRKDVKYLGYQVALLCPDEDPLGELAGSLTRLGGLLGDDHDLAMWGEALSAGPALDHLLEQIDGRRLELQTEAFALGRVLTDPDAVVDEIAAAWRRSRG